MELKAVRALNLGRSGHEGVLLTLSPTGSHWVFINEYQSKEGDIPLSRVTPCVCVRVAFERMRLESPNSACHVLGAKPTGCLFS